MIGGFNPPAPTEYVAIGLRSSKARCGGIWMGVEGTSGAGWAGLPN